MTINELIEALNSKPNVHGDLKVKVSAMGGIGSGGSEVTGVHVGFDWDMGSIILTTQVQLWKQQQKRPVGAAEIVRECERLGFGARSEDGGFVPDVNKLLAAARAATKAEVTDGMD